MIRMYKVSAICRCTAAQHVWRILIPKELYHGSLASILSTSSMSLLSITGRKSLRRRQQPARCFLLYGRRWRVRSPISKSRGLTEGDGTQLKSHECIRHGHGYDPGLAQMDKTYSIRGKRTAKQR